MKIRNAPEDHAHVCPFAPHYNSNLQIDHETNVRVCRNPLRFELWKSSSRRRQFGSRLLSVRTSQTWRRQQQPRSYDVPIEPIRASHRRRVVLSTCRRRARDFRFHTAQQNRKRTWRRRITRFCTVFSFFSCARSFSWVRVCVTTDVAYNKNTETT